MLIFDRSHLADQGLEIRETETGFILEGGHVMPDGARMVLRDVAGDLGLDLGQQDEVVEFVASLTMWAAVKRASEEARRRGPLMPKEGNGKAKSKVLR